VSRHLAQLIGMEGKLRSTHSFYLRHLLPFLYSFLFFFLLIYYSPPPPPLSYLLPLPIFYSYSISQLSPLFSISLHTLILSSRICYSYRNSTMTSLLYLRISRRIRQFGRIGKFSNFIFLEMYEVMPLCVYC
jgi:hypothetical protein